MQNNNKAHTVDESMTAIRYVLNDKLISDGILPSQPSDLNLGHFYLW